MVTNTSSVEEQLANLTEAIAGLTKFMQNQEARIDKLTDMVGILMEEESTHAPGKLPEVQGSDSPPRQVASTKVIPVSSEEIIPIDQLKEFIEGTIKNKYEVAAKSSLTYTSYDVLLGRPWIHENKVVPSTYHQYLKYYEGEVEKKIVADNEPFTEAASHFVDAKFYLKNRIVKELKADDVIKSKNDEPTTKRAKVTTGRVKDITEEELTLSVKRIEAVKLSLKPLAGFVAQNRLQNVALPTKRTDEGFDPNAYRLFAKVGYNPNEPSKLGKLPSQATTRQPREVYTKERDEDEENVGSSYHITVQGENGVPSSMEDNAELEDVSPCYHISFNDGDPQEDEDVKDAPPELEEGVKTTIDTLKEVNFGTDEEPRPTYLSALLEADEERTYIELLKEFRDVFAWSYKEIPGLDTKVAVHHLAVKNGARPVKQAQRHFRPDLVPLIETEINKLIEDGFICEVKYPTWVSRLSL
ncbi:uncharacterized protein [Nicotiana sylvestris]|uniref:uncharacterized protein n=1 Tax=Nicotiana sylvestris TaxID=4096 RepID=UPI00388CB0F8